VWKGPLAAQNPSQPTAAVLARPRYDSSSSDASASAYPTTFAWKRLRYVNFSGVCRPLTSPYFHRRVAEF
jgi:hypothetical protein